jgi:hypothetical protein
MLQVGATGKRERDITLAATSLQDSFLLGLFFDPEDVGDTFLRIGCLSTDYTALYPRR